MLTPTSSPVAESGDGEALRLAWLEGHTAAMSARDNELTDAISAWQAATRALGDTATRLRAQVAATVHALSVAIARHLVERELAADPAIVRQLVMRALHIAPMNGTLTVRMHPEDLDAITAAGGPGEVAGTGIDLRWTADDTLTRGSCMVEGPAAIVDGRLDRALLDIYERISHE